MNSTNPVKQVVVFVVLIDSSHRIFLMGKQKEKIDVTPSSYT